MSKLYKVLRVEDFDGNKKVHLECQNDLIQHTVTVFSDYADYDKVLNGNIVDGWIRKKGIYSNLVSYCKPERNWADNEEFI